MNFDRVASSENRKFVTETLQKLTHNSVWTDKIVQQVEAGEIEARCFLAWLAKRLNPRTYLEVGVFRGFSMAVVVAKCPEIDVYGFDLWVPGYGKTENPGPPFIQAELQKVGYHKIATLVTGNSHWTLPVFFGNYSRAFNRARGVRTAFYLLRTVLSIRRILRLSRNRPESFDLILVDGDHSFVGAYQDLSDIMPYCSIGGAVVFDDIVKEPSCLDAWRAVQGQFKNFSYYEYTENLPGVGVAIRES